VFDVTSTGDTTDEFASVTLLGIVDFGAEINAAGGATVDMLA